MDIYGDPRFDDLLYQIVDISEVEQFTATSEDVDAAAALDDAATITKPRLVVAVVAVEGEALAVAEFYKFAMIASRWNVRIFSTIEEATQWVHRTCGIERGNETI